MVASIWLRHNGHGVLDRLVEAFIIAVTIIVVAIPEGKLYDILAQYFRSVSILFFPSSMLSAICRQ